jgi:3-methyl-2-oxobutanoate hydroxymethyltransferase
MKPRTTTIRDLYSLKKVEEKIVCVTAYDATMARLVAKAGVDLILVGDSLGMVVQGHENTLEVTLEQMIYHCRMVSRGAQGPFLTADLPFGTFQVSTQKGVESAVRLLKEGRVQSVKIEGAAPGVITIIKQLVAHGIPVMGHLGLTPQSVHKFGGFVKQGSDSNSGRKIKEDALKLQDAGVHALVLECIPAQLAEEITSRLEIPTIGIGAGPSCDGQVLVINDILGLDERFAPKFAKIYPNLAKIIRESVQQFSQEVKKEIFPS